MNDQTSAQDCINIAQVLGFRYVALTEGNKVYGGKDNLDNAQLVMDMTEESDAATACAKYANNLDAAVVANDVTFGGPLSFDMYELSELPEEQLHASKLMASAALAIIMLFIA